MKRASWVALVVVAQGFGSIAFAEGWDPDSKASNSVSDGIKGTRHDLTINYLTNGNEPVMDIYRNDYGEVCVYCHTPHGANSSPDALRMPLWNRTINPNLSYELYTDVMATTLQLAGDQTASDPGPASLSCLSCHDGITAIDSIINMPGSGMYRKSQEISSNSGFLDTWDLGQDTNHVGLGRCAEQCHNPTGSTIFTSPGDFSKFVIGAGTIDPDGKFISYTSPTGGTVVDLRDDHPVGVLYPTATAGAPGVDFFPMDVMIPGRYAFFDDGNGRADKYELRAYDSTGGGQYEIECASCHDPHGVPDSSGATFIPSFLRVENTGSALCLTCHDK